MCWLNGVMSSVGRLCIYKLLLPNPKHGQRLNSCGGPGFCVKDRPHVRVKVPSEGWTIRWCAK